MFVSDVVQVKHCWHSSFCFTLYYYLLKTSKRKNYKKQLLKSAKQYLRELIKKTVLQKRHIAYIELYTNLLKTSRQHVRLARGKATRMPDMSGE